MSDQEINHFYGNTVSYFYGDGLNVSSEEIGHGQDETKWRVGDKIEITEYDKEIGEFTDYYTINEIKHDEDGDIYASVYYSGNSLEE